MGGKIMAYYYLGQDAKKQGLSYENNYTEKQKKQCPLCNNKALNNAKKLRTGKARL